MFTISTELATNIVTMCEEKASCKIGLTNHQGKVLARNSDLPEVKVDQAGRLSMRRGQKTVLISDTDADDTRQDTFQIVAAPLIIEGRVLGAICMESEVSLANKIFSLVIGFVHQILEKNVLMEQFRSGLWNFQELLLHIVRQPLSPTDRYLCKKFGIDVHKNWRVTLVEWEAYKTVGEEVIRHILKKQNKSELIALEREGRFLWLLPGNLTKNEAQDLYGNIKKTMSSAGIETDIFLVVGADAFSAKGLPESYESAFFLSVLGKVLNKSTIYFEDYILSVSLLHYGETWYGERLLEPINKLFKEDKKRQLVKTLRAFILCNGEVNRCADKIVVHRNTLRYRLERIHEITGLNPHDFQELFSLFAGLLIFRRKDWANRQFIEDI